MFFRVRRPVLSGVLEREASESAALEENSLSFRSFSSGLSHCQSFSSSREEADGFGFVSLWFVFMSLLFPVLAFSFIADAKSVPTVETRSRIGQSDPVRFQKRREMGGTQYGIVKEIFQLSIF